MDDDIDRVAALAALGEPLRRRVYEVATSADEVSRDDVAQALGVPRSVAAFHLDKLAKVGLLDIDYRRPAGRAGPGAGRPTKWYRRSAREVAFSVPARSYELAASLLAEAIERATSGARAVAETLEDVARARGRRLGAARRRDASGRRPPGERLEEALARAGYEPSTSGEVVTLSNCPFHALAGVHRELVCAMNHALLRGLVTELGLPEAAAVLDPDPGRCCVTIATGPR